MTIAQAPPKPGSAPSKPKATPGKSGIRTRRGTSLFARGEPMLWMTGGTLIFLIVMIVGLLALVVEHGASTFWPRSIVRVQTIFDQPYMGQSIETESYDVQEAFLSELPESANEAVRAKLEANDFVSTREKLRTGNFDLTGTHYTWVADFELTQRELPEWAVTIERLTWGRFYGLPVAFELDGETVSEGASAAWKRFEQEHETIRERWRTARDIEEEEIGEINGELEDARLRLKEVELEHGRRSSEFEAATQSFESEAADIELRYEGFRKQVQELDAENERYRLVLEIADGSQAKLGLDQIVRAVPSNQLGFWGKLRVYFSRWAEFILDDPREANNEGGVFPAIFGTVAMTIVMSIVVVPFGVLAALYLREYAKQGVIVSIVRIAVNNLAGVPSIVYGVFGLGFFCYIVGATIDELFFASKLPSPTFGTGGILWASLTLALLTLPVVIVATEEALSAVPSSMREGSFACGATKWQTIRRIVLPRAMPGIMTGMILAIARGAGEVAPLMLVGAVKVAPELPLEMAGLIPIPHPERSFMHLGFHIYDLGFQSQNSEAAKPMVYTTTLLLIGIIVGLNVFAIWIRGRLRKRYAAVSI